VKNKYINYKKEEEDEEVNFTIRMSHHDIDVRMQQRTEERE
jgi:hypothetical protein